MPPAPPIPTTLLASSPQFASLVNDLTTNRLTPNCGTLPTPEDAKSEQELEQELRLNAAVIAKARCLEYAVRYGDLPEELETIINLHLHPPKDTSTPLPPLPDSIPLTVPLPPVPLLPKDIPASRAPYDIDSRLNRLYAPSTSNVNKFLSELHALTQLLNDLLNHLTGLLTSLRGTQVSYALARARFLQYLTAGLRGKILVLKGEILKEVYGERGGGKAALKNYREHLVDTRTRLVARRRVVETELARYEEAGGEMQSIVEKYGKVGRRIEILRGEIRKLGGDV